MSFSPKDDGFRDFVNVGEQHKTSGAEETGRKVPVFF